MEDGSSCTSGSSGYQRDADDNLVAEDEENIERGVEDIIEIVVGDLNQSILHRELEG